MHAPSHSDSLPAGVDPIPVPDSRREAELLCLLLDAGLYPQIRVEERALDGESSKADASD